MERSQFPVLDYLILLNSSFSCLGQVKREEIPAASLSSSEALCCGRGLLQVAVMGSYLEDSAETNLGERPRKGQQEELSVPRSSEGDAAEVQRCLCGALPAVIIAAVGDMEWFFKGNCLCLGCK